MDDNTKEVLSLAISAAILIIQSIALERTKANGRKLNENTGITISAKGDSEKIHKCIDQTKEIATQTHQLVIETKEKITQIENRLKEKEIE